jgi:hypothetical protein
MRAVGECGRVARAGWKRENVSARWSVECGRAVGECEGATRVPWKSAGAWRAQGGRGKCECAVESGVWAHGRSG